jgi:hypothetical protein
MSIRDEIEAKYSRELEGYRQLGGLAHDLLVQNEHRMALDTARASTAAAMGLHAKARKSFLALELIAREGFGEDAMILARSLTNLCIDLGYICRADSDNRARQWMARGRVSRRQLAQTFGLVPPDENEVDWPAMMALAKKWRDVPIVDRAKDAELVNFYEIAYRHGSVFEHSDAWGALAFLEIVDNVVAIQPNPSPRLVGTALLAGAFAFAQIVEIAGHFWSFDFFGRDAEMHSIVTTAFRTAEKGKKGKP